MPSKLLSLKLFEKQLLVNVKLVVCLTWIAVKCIVLPEDLCQVPCIILQACRRYTLVTSPQLYEVGVRGGKWQHGRWKIIIIEGNRRRGVARRHKCTANFLQLFLFAAVSIMLWELNMERFEAEHLRKKRFDRGKHLCLLKPRTLLKMWVTLYVDSPPTETLQMKLKFKSF